MNLPSHSKKNKTSTKAEDWGAHQHQPKRRVRVRLGLGLGQIPSEEGYRIEDASISIAFAVTKSNRPDPRG
jgi:hypothetical protein